MENLKNDLRIIMEKYSLTKVVFAIRDLIDEENQFVKLTIEDKEDLRDANSVCDMAKILATRFGDYCGDNHFGLSLAKWTVERKESARAIIARLDALAEQKREEYDRAEYKRL